MSEDPLVLRADTSEEGEVVLLSPSVGIFIPSVATGALLGTGQSIGAIDVLGVKHELVVPDGVAGRLTERCGGSLARVPVQHGDALATLSTASLGHVASRRGASRAESAGTSSFNAPMSGRFYSRPSPAEPAFIEPGDVVSRGQTIGLLEVMKTFNRLVYQGDALPERATIAKIVPRDGDDVVRGDPILLLGEADG